MYSVTKEKSNEKIQEAILYSPARLQVRPRPAPSATWRGGERGNSPAIRWPVTQAVGEGTATPCISLMFYWQHAEALNPDLNPQYQDRVRGSVPKNKRRYPLWRHVWKQKKQTWTMVFFSKPIASHRIIPLFMTLYGGEKNVGKFLIIPIVNILLWNCMRMKNEFIFLETMLKVLCQINSAWKLKALCTHTNTHTHSPTRTHTSNLHQLVPSSKTSLKNRTNGGLFWRPMRFYFG